MRAALLVVAIGCGAPATSDVGVDAASSIDGNGSGSGSSDAAMTSATCTGKTMQPRETTWTMNAGGREREAIVHVPASYDPSKRTPIVIDIHGRTGWAAQQAQLSHSRAKSDATGFIAIYPESATSPTSWNAGSCCDPATAENVDDMAFIEKLVDEAAARLCVDPDRVYVMGLSNGGYLAHRVACEMGDRVAAIGSVAGLLIYQQCAPSRPMPLFQVHGTSDTLVSYDWVDETIDYWRQTNSCTTQSTTYQKGDATCVTHGGCAGGGDVVLCTIAGGGHQWPGGDALPFLGKKSDDLIATDAIWSFFVAHPH